MSNALVEMAGMGQRIVANSFLFEEMTALSTLMLTALRCLVPAAAGSGSRGGAALKTRQQSVSALCSLLADERTITAYGMDVSACRTGKCPSRSLPTNRHS